MPETKPWAETEAEEAKRQKAVDLIMEGILLCRKNLFLDESVDRGISRVQSCSVATDSRPALRSKDNKVVLRR